MLDELPRDSGVVCYQPNTTVRQQCLMPRFDVDDVRDDRIMRKWRNESSIQMSCVRMCARVLESRGMGLTVPKLAWDLLVKLWGFPFIY
jgi:hypothetical protein